MSAVDPADVRAQACAELGLLRELAKPRRVEPHPHQGGSSGYPVWSREEQLRKWNTRGPVECCLCLCPPPLCCCHHVAAAALPPSRRRCRHPCCRHPRCCSCHHYRRCRRRLMDAMVKKCVRVGRWRGKINGSGCGCGCSMRRIAGTTMWNDAAQPTI